MLSTSEDRRHTLDTFASWAASRLHILVLIAASTWIFCLQSEVISGNQNFSGDNGAHILAQEWINHAIDQGDNPMGPLGMELGVPYLQFYQPLHALASVALSRLLSIDISVVHSHLVAILFSLAPLSLCFLFRRLGLGRIASTTAAIVSATSVSGFSSSFEAYYNVGLATQAMGFFFFPLFLGSLWSLLRRGGIAAASSLLLGVTLLSHSMNAVYVFLCVILIIVMKPSLFLRRWKSAALVGLAGMALASFWLVPFVANTIEFRPTAPGGNQGAIRGPAWWFDGVETGDLFDLAATGRLFDGPRSIDRKRDPLDDLSDRNDLIRSKHVRPPVLSALILIGLAATLLRLKIASRRFLLGGFLLSLTLYLGPDDFPPLRLIPMIDSIQVFRTIYLLELFSFGLVAVAVDEIIRWAVRLSDRTRVNPLALVTAAAAFACLPLLAWTAYETDNLADAYLDPGQFKELEGPPAAFLTREVHPFRVNTKYPGGVKRSPSGLESGRHQDHCTHWLSVGPLPNISLCSTLRRNPTSNDIYAYAAVRYFSGPVRPGSRRSTRSLEKLKSRFAGEEVTPVLEENVTDYFLDNRLDSFATLFTGPVVAVDANPPQWQALISCWLEDNGSNPNLEHTAVPLRSTGVDLLASPGRSTRLDLTDLSVTHADLKQRACERWRSRSIPPAGEGGTGCSVRLRETPDSMSFQRFEFEVICDRPALLSVPVVAVRGWTATVDGSAAPVHPGVANFVTVQTPPGEHVVSISWSWGLLEISSASLAAILALLLASLALVSWVSGHPPQKK